MRKNPKSLRYLLYTCVKSCRTAESVTSLAASLKTSARVTTQRHVSLTWKDVAALCGSEYICRRVRHTTQLQLWPALDRDVRGDHCLPSLPAAAHKLAAERRLAQSRQRRLATRHRSRELSIIDDVLCMTADAWHRTAQRGRGATEPHWTR